VLDRKTLTILSANPSAEETYGYTKEELVGRPFTDLGPFDLDEIKWTELNAQHAGNVTTISSKVQYFKKGHARRFMSMCMPARHFMKTSMR
jgi:two-component system NtrC family sensor kinase